MKRLINVLLGLGLALVSSSALAAGGAATDSAHGEAHINWWGLGKEYAHAPALGLLFVTFFVFLFGLVFLLKMPLQVHLENRSDLVKKAIEEARRAKDAAEARARDAEQKLRDLDDEIQKMKRDFETQGKAEAERIEKVAHAAASRIQKDAEDTIAAERERAMQVLRAEAAKLALQLAEERIKGALTPTDDLRLQKTLVEHLAKHPQA
jgi:F-type H+-transporting ATPase subunit b